jgi:aminoglycoside phosphotransferase (APT) family kinase protein
MRDEPELPGVDLARLAGYLARERPGLVDGPLSGSLIPGGRSNLTYVISDGHREWVLRRPPLGHVLATAHDMGREHRVITALAGTVVPVPRTVLLCPDPGVLGAPFYLMELVEGIVYRHSAQAAGLSTAERWRLAADLVHTLAGLHRVDPAAVGLGDFGRPDGFLARQVRRWSTQLAASRSREVPGIDDLARRLAATVPASPAPGIVHGDYRLDNVLVKPAPEGIGAEGTGFPAPEGIGAEGTATITAVLDWEMSTLGDPLTDLGLLLVYWTATDFLGGLGARHGFPPGEQLIEWYAAGTGTDLSSLDWYVALASFKLAVILEGIHYRWTLGQTVGDGFDQIGAMVAPLVELGLGARR